MTATSHPKRGTIRLVSMESLGFLDGPSRSWSTPSVSQTAQAGPASSEFEHAGLIPLPVGRHSPHAEPSGELVKDIWDSTELHAPSLADWSPQSFGTKHLGSRRFRWPMLLLLVTLTLILAGGALWLYGEPSGAAGNALGRVEAEAVALSDTISQVLPLVDDLDEDRLPEANQDASVFFAMGERARSMFAASAQLPTEDTEDRTAAAAAAGLVIDASRLLMDATAYRTALEPSLALPLLETDPDLTDLTTAAEAFTEWRAGFEAIRESLPKGVAAETATALEEISGGLETTQDAYLDAMRTDNRGAAVEALGTLRADLLAARQAMLADMEVVAAAVSELIDEAKAELERLLG